MLNTHQKMALAVVVVIGTATLLFDVINLRKSVNVPFFRPQATGVIRSADEMEQERMAALKIADTDADGLTDYDELYVFRTSPYLEDTDSDSTADGEEIGQNTDPNCPAGKTCRLTSLASGGGQQAAGLTPVEIVVPEAQGAPVIGMGSIAESFSKILGDPATLTLATAEERLAKLSGAELRKFYIDLGMPSDLIQKASDSALRTLMLETLKEAGVPAGESAPSGSGGDE